jgi:hypothetical protein
VYQKRGGVREEEREEKRRGGEDLRGILNS